MLDALEKAAISNPYPFCSAETYRIGSSHRNPFPTFDPQRDERR